MLNVLYKLQIRQFLMGKKSRMYNKIDSPTDRNEAKNVIFIYYLVFSLLYRYEHKDIYT